MKRVLLFLFFLLLLNASVTGQPYKTSGGIRIGFPYGLTVKHFTGINNALEFIAAANMRGFVLSVLMENEHRIHSDSRVYWYWGAGVHGGIVDVSKNPYLYFKETYAGPVLGVDALIGFDFTLRRRPFNFSFDIMPSINIAGFTGWNGLNTAISVRYVF